jgi:hypothetical protein
MLRTPHSPPLQSRLTRMLCMFSPCATMRRCVLAPLCDVRFVFQAPSSVTSTKLTACFSPPQLLAPTDAAGAAHWTAQADIVSANVMKHLWDAKRAQLKPHIYDLGTVPGSPRNWSVCGDKWGSTEHAPAGGGWGCFPSKGSPFLGVPGFNEQDVYYHGATAVAIEAQILNSTAQVQQALARMQHNVALACAPATNCLASTIGLTLWPPYPNATNAPAQGPGLPPAPRGGMAGATAT